MTTPSFQAIARMAYIDAINAASVELLSRIAPPQPLTDEFEKRIAAYVKSPGGVGDTIAMLAALRKLAPLEIKVQEIAAGIPGRPGGKLIVLRLRLAAEALTFHQSVTVAKAPAAPQPPKSFDTVHGGALRDMMEPLKGICEGEALYNIEHGFDAVIRRADSVTAADKSLNKAMIAAGMPFIILAVDDKGAPLKVSGAYPGIHCAVYDAEAGERKAATGDNIAHVTGQWLAKAVLKQARTRQFPGLT